MTRFKRFFGAAAAAFFLAAVLVLGYLLRQPTFWLPHWDHGQSRYLALAAKMHKWGIKGYERSGETLRQGTVPPEGWRLGFWDLASCSPPGAALERNPYRIAPLFPMLLSYSHRWFSERNQPFIVVFSRDGGKQAAKDRPDRILQFQLWAAIVPLLAGLGVIAAVFFLGWALFNPRVACFAALLCAASPFLITTSSRLGPEDLFAFLILSSWLMAWASVLRRSAFGAFAAGFTGGLSVLTHWHGVFFVFGMSFHLGSVLGRRMFMAYSAGAVLALWEWAGIMAGHGLFGFGGVWGQGRSVAGILVSIFAAFVAVLLERKLKACGGSPVEGPSSFSFIGVPVLPFISFLAVAGIEDRGAFACLYGFAAVLVAAGIDALTRFFKRRTRTYA